LRWDFAGEDACPSPLDVAAVKQNQFVAVDDGRDPICPLHVIQQLHAAHGGGGLVPAKAEFEGAGRTVEIKFGTNHTDTVLFT